MDNLEKFIFYEKIFNDDELSQLLKCASNSMLKRKKYTYSSNISWQKGNRNVSFDFNLGNFNYDQIIHRYVLSMSDKYKMHLINLFYNYNYCPDEKITKYDKNDMYQWHNDLLFGEKGIRVLSSITYLNDD